MEYTKREQPYRTTSPCGLTTEYLMPFNLLVSFTRYYLPVASYWPGCLYAGAGMTALRYCFHRILCEIYIAAKLHV